MNLERASEDAIKYSKITSMAELKNEYKMENDSIAPTAYGSVPMRMAIAMPIRESMLSSKKAAPDSFTPFMPSAMPDAAAPVEENYSVASDEINYQQSERLVQKILNRKK